MRPGPMPTDKDPNAESRSVTSLARNKVYIIDTLLKTRYIKNDMEEKEEKKVDKYSNGLEIVTFGRASKSFAYDQVNVKLTFISKKGDSKSAALSSVTRAIEEFDKKVWSKINGPMKRKFKYDIGMQSADDAVVRIFVINFAFSKESLTQFIRLTESLTDKPLYEITFSFTEAKKNQNYNAVLQMAVLNARARAEIIASGVGSRLPRCIKVNFDEQADGAAEGQLAGNPMLADNFEIPPGKELSAETDEKSERKAEYALSQEIIRHIEKTFVMEEVEMTASVECIWFAE
jgi:hypothetical protein